MATAARKFDNGRATVARHKPPMWFHSPLHPAATSGKYACPCGGGCPRCQGRLPVQAKLSVSQPGDAAEQEADRVAEQLLRMPQPEIADNAAAHESTRSNDGPPIRDVVDSPGKALDSPTRAFMEPRFGREFTNVRVHTDARAAQSAQAMNALAYTVGRNIVFAPGQFAPASPAGQRLIAHELAHVVQQSGGPPMLQMQRGGKPATTKQRGKIKHYFHSKVEDLYLWPGAWGAIATMQATAVGNEIWNALEQAGAIVTIIFVAERKDIPGSSSTSTELGFCEDLGQGQFAVYVLAGQESAYMERTGHGSETLKTRIVARPQDEIADTLFHELLHAWFLTMFPGEPIPTGHTAKALGVGDPKFDPKEYDPRFLKRLQRFTKELEKLRSKEESAARKP